MPLLLKTLALNAALLTAPVAVAAAGDSAVSLGVGNMKYTKTDSAVPLQGSASVFALEYSQFAAADRSYFGGYRQDLDNLSKRSNYLAIYGGARYFPLHIGYPVDAPLSDANVSYDAPAKPYVEGAVALGHGIYKVQDANGYELGNDIFGVHAGLGVALHPFGRWVFDAKFLYESYQSRGGSGSISLSGRNIYLLITNGFVF